MHLFSALSALFFLIKSFLQKRLGKNFRDKANEDLWRRYLNIHGKFNVKFHWVKGHSGVAENEVCDKLAKGAAEGKDLKVDQGYIKSITPGATLL